MVKLVDTHVSEACVRKDMRVRVPPSAQFGIPACRRQGLVFGCECEYTSIQHVSVYENLMICQDLYFRLALTSKLKYNEITNWIL